MSSAPVPGGEGGTGIEGKDLSKRKEPINIAHEPLNKAT